MAAKLGILVVHGMGSQKDPHFADEMTKEVNDRVKKLGFAPGADLAWQPVYWADILEPHETQLWNALKEDHKLSFEGPRKFILSNLGDAVAYQRQPDSAPDVYQRIHTAVHECIVALHENLGQQDVPLIIMAHSLGSYILSNYIWDRQHHYEDTRYGQTAFERMETLASIITFGSNIAVFSLALAKYVGIGFPAAELSPELKAAARWLNLFDPQDILAYPIKPLCAAYMKNPQIQDIEINVGNLLTSWNPLSHDGYWTDNDFTERVAKQIAVVLSAL